ncbi:MAG TPA: 50S ribosomal protein L1 [Candidatus Caldiarchaeum subterraneum]|uniref:Large ribosomal subunit protein uL1 n=1 Tax=Caldiarchaeum subterraneum TaxID=311458 RepID=A0A832ZUK2_CALS0|nr:50S ribosomal protein L1 [Candidatus Caldarchaeum subterraneum]
MKAILSNFLEAVKKAKELKGSRNFKQSVEVIINIKGVDLTKPENRFSEIVELPHELGRKRRKICIIASGNLAMTAKRIQGVDRVIEKEELEALVGNRREAKKLASRYDFFLVEPALVGLAARALGAALGARGKNPIPIPPGQDLERMVQRYANSVTVRMRKIPQVAAIVGTEEMEDQKIAENAEAVFNRVVEKLEKRIRNINSVYVKTTMGKPVEVEIKE